jgi:hypothetical protein
MPGVWFAMLGGDSRLGWDATTLPDRRVERFWDQEHVGAWFIQHVAHAPGVAWDVFCLYDPDAAWHSEPKPLMATGRTVFGERAFLQEHVERQPSQSGAPRQFWCNRWLSVPISVNQEAAPLLVARNRSACSVPDGQERSLLYTSDKDHGR